MKVSEIMSRRVVTIGRYESCCDAVTRMHRAKVRHLPVIDDGGQLVGIVTDRDLRHRLFSPAIWHHIGSVPVDTLLKSVRVDEIMSSPVITTAPGDELEVAARVMLEDKVGSLPVVEDGRVVGIVTETDLLRRIVETDTASPEIEEIIVSFP